MYVEILNACANSEHLETSFQLCTLHKSLKLFLSLSVYSHPTVFHCLSSEWTLEEPNTVNELKWISIRASRLKFSLEPITEKKEGKEKKIGKKL